MLTVLDLFSGIGGFSLGLERTGGFRTVAFCEIDPYCRAVLARHWPGVPIHGDICTLVADALDARSPRAGGEPQYEGKVLQPLNGDPEEGRGIDLICGGFPCQDISTAGKGAGLAGARSGLWREYHRLIRELRPRYVIVENVSALLGRGLCDLVGDLASVGYDAEWHCIPASYVGAPHRRDRVWIVAYPQGERIQGRRSLGEQITSAYAQSAISVRDRPGSGANHWIIEPNVGRVAHGVPARVDRLRALGNAIVPQIAEMIGRAILASQP